MPRAWQALQRGESARERRRVIEQAYAELIGAPDTTASADGQALPAQLRPLVYESWLRSCERTLDPVHVPAAPGLSADELRELQRLHPMSRVLPVIHRLLLQEATDSGFIIAVGDAEGRLLWVDGEHRLRARAEDMGFTAGMDWSESAVGTSAPGSSLVLGHALQVLGEEHYNQNVHEWSCTASPVRDPVTGSLLGFIDVTGGDEAASPQILPLVEATVATVEAELKLESLKAQMMQTREQRDRPVRAPARRDTRVSRLLVLGRNHAVLEHGSTSVQLSRRHAELLIALTLTPAGLPASVLATQVYEAPNAEQTLRAEVVRLRRALSDAGAPVVVASRPYKLEGDLRIDAVEVLHALATGSHRVALAAYEGTVLPSSDAPVIESLRADVDGTLREAMLQSATPELLYDYAQNWARDDREVWETLLQVLPRLSPKRARAIAKLESL